MTGIVSGVVRIGVLPEFHFDWSVLAPTGLSLFSRALGDNTCPRLILMNAVVRFALLVQFDSGIAFCLVYRMSPTLACPVRPCVRWVAEDF